ncbi:DNA polymerase III subunit delta' [Motiliproteus sp. MSK22-1]|uniref:DNA polymerase III subunit delta' n=1 Tax=Motiliproteus sp. MSK22-1 TaxID=1897630 RepID=UPI000978590C|nr:DNA polymerase III subunit delta' [Motiliproteus sp. MSK22-1]OMH32661.1 DNA polymerase III subunit delta' [Motiliproteus sp. MSK22-1]
MSSEPTQTYFSWQQDNWHNLRLLQQRNRLPHALLFSGVKGIGKLHFARAFGRYMLCSNPASPEGEQGAENQLSQVACEKCKACLLTQQGTHPDMVEIVPDEPGKPIKIDQIRELTRFVASSPQQGGYRIVIICPPEEMNINAGNAVLKVLEEPGKNTLFMLVSHSSGRLMATIRSRCQAINFSQPKKAESIQWLQQKSDNDNIDLLLSICNGSPLSALDFLNDQGLERRSAVLAGLKGAASRRLSVTEVAQQWQKEKPDSLLEWLSSLISDFIRYKMSESVDKVVNKDAEKLITKASFRVQEEKLFAFIDKIQEYRLQVISKTNPNQQLMYEDLLVGWVGLFDS